MKVLFLLVNMLWFVSIVFANSTIDCQWTALSTKEGFVKAIHENLAFLNPKHTLSIFTDKDLGVVLEHHQQYCCQVHTNESTCEGKLDGKHYFPESPYLIDHLINIGMRKFNGIQEHCDLLWIDCFDRNNKVLLKERREESQKLAEETNGLPPSQLYELFKKYWWDVTTFAKPDSVHQIANAYYTMCYEAVKIWESLKANQADWINQSDAWLQWCYKLVQKRYIEESSYVQSLMVDKGVQYLYDNMRSYLQTYFVDKRMNAFVDKFGKLDACFNMVLKYVTRTSCCVD